MQFYVLLELHQKLLEGDERFMNDDQWVSIGKQDVGRRSIFPDTIVRRKCLPTDPGALPEYCLSVSPSDAIQYQPDEQPIIKLKLGVKGYFQTTMEGRSYIDEFNKMSGITPMMQEGMSVGSIFGFDVPGVDPRNYVEEGGRLRRISDSSFDDFRVRS